MCWGQSVRDGRRSAPHFRVSVHRASPSPHIEGRCPNLERILCSASLSGHLLSVSSQVSESPCRLSRGSGAFLPHYRGRRRVAPGPDQRRDHTQRWQLRYGRQGRRQLKRATVSDGEGARRVDTFLTSGGASRSSEHCSPLQAPSLRQVKRRKWRFCKAGGVGDVCRRCRQ